MACSLNVYFSAASHQVFELLYLHETGFHHMYFKLLLLPLEHLSQISNFVVANGVWISMELSKLHFIYGNWHMDVSQTQVNLSS